jgi:glycogen synthase
MASLRYGTIPIVRRRPADSVELLTRRRSHRRRVQRLNTEAMSWALGYALDLHAQPALWSRLVRNACSRTFLVAPGRQ